MNKKKKEISLESFTSPDTNPEFNSDIEQSKEIIIEDDLDLIFDVTTDDDTLNDDMIKDEEND
jgi:hypothetical protein